MFQELDKTIVRAGEQRGQAGEVDKDGSRMTLVGNLDFIQGTISSLASFPFHCNFNHYLAPEPISCHPILQEFQGV